MALQVPIESNFLEEEHAKNFLISLQKLLSNAVKPVFYNSNLTAALNTSKKTECLGWGVLRDLDLNCLDVF